MAEPLRRAWVATLDARSYLWPWALPENGCALHDMIQDNPMDKSTEINVMGAIYKKMQQTRLVVGLTFLRDVLAFLCLFLIIK